MTGTRTAARAARHRWIFRAVALLFVFFGLVWLWRFGFTDYHPQQRPLGLAAGVLALLVGAGLMALRRWAIAASAVAMAFVGVSAAVFAPNAIGPVILALAALTLVCACYTVLAIRVVLAAPGPPRAD